MKTHTPNSTRQPAMKNTRKPSRILATSAAALLAAGLMLGTAQAYAPNFWDVNGIGAGFGGTGNWDVSTTANWNDITGINPVSQFWGAPTNPNNGIFQGTTGTATLTGATGLVLVNDLTFRPTTFVAGAPLGFIIATTGAANSGLAFAGGTGAGGSSLITLGGAGSPDSATTINAPISSVGGVGITVQSFLGTTTSSLALNANNTFTGAFNVNSGTVLLNSPGPAFGQGISGSALTIGTASAAGSTTVAVVRDNGSGANINANALVTVNGNGLLDISTGLSFESAGGLAGNGLVNLGALSLLVGNGGAAGYSAVTATQTFSGSISGVGGKVTFNGPGATWTLAGVAGNSYTGLTTVTAGILNIQNSASLGSAAAGTVVATGATLQLQGGINVVGEALTITGTGAAGQNGALVNTAGVNIFSGPITLGGATTIAVDAGTLNLTSTTNVGGAANALTLTGVAATSGTLAGGLTAAAISSVTKNGVGTWILSGANSYTGPTTINAGTLQAGAASTAFGSNSAVTLTGTSTLDIAGFTEIIGSLNSASATTVVTNSGVAATLVTGALNTADSYIGTITGALALTKNGTNTFTIGGTGANTYSGQTTVLNGTLQVTNTGASALGAVGTVATGTVVSTGAMLQLAVGGVNIGNEFLSIAGTGVGGVGALNNLSGTNTFGGPISLTAASTIGVTAGTLNLTSAGPLTSVGGPFALTLDAAVAGATGNLSSVIDSGISAVNKTGAGTWKLIGASTYSGPTNVTGGTLQAGVATVGGAIPTSGAFGINSVMTVTAPGILDLNGFSNTVGSLAGTGTVDNTSVLGATLTTGTAGSTGYSGVIKNTAGTLGLTKVGAATVFFLTGANTYTGLTTVAQGMLVAGSANALGSGAALPTATGAAPGITVATGASLELTFAGVVTGSTGPLTLTLAGTGTALNGVAAANTGALVAGVAGSTFDGSIFIAPGGATISANGFTLTLGTIAQPTEFLNKNGVNLTLNGGGGAGKIVVNEAIIGAAANSDLIVSNGATDLNVANSYNGKTFIDNRLGANGVLNTGVLNALPTANGRTTLVLDIGGAAGSASTLNIAGTALNAAGANQSIASLQGLAASKVTLGANTLTIGFGLGAVDVNGAANANFAGIISGTGGITKDENSTQIFSGLNTYTGATTVINGKLQAGVGQAGAAGAFGTNSNVTVGSAATIAGGTAPVLELAGFNETIGSLSGLAAAGGFVQNNFGAAGSTALLTLGSGGGSGNFGGVLRDAPPVGAVGAGTLSIKKIGIGTQTFSGINTYTGPTTVNGGTLQAGSLQAFGINTVMTVANGAVLELANFSNTIGSLSDGGVFPASGTVQNTLANGPGAAVLTIAGINAAGAAGAVGFGGTINDFGAPTSLALVKNGAGTQSLSGQSSYTGGTTLNAGVLDIDASSVAVALPPSANPVATGPLGTGTLFINAGEIGTGVGTGGANATNAIGNVVQVNGNFSVSNVVLSPAVLGAPSVNAGLPAVGTAVVNTVAFGLGGAAAFTFISDGVAFTGPVNLNQPGVATVITTNSGFLDLSGRIADLVPGTGGGLTFSGNTATYLGSSGLGGGIPGILGQADASNTYAGLTTVTGGLVVLGKNNFATAIPGNLQINAGAAVWVDSASAGTTANQIAVTSNVLVNGGLDLSGRNQAINNLTGTGLVELDDINGANIGKASVFSVNSGNFGGAIFDNGKGGQLVKNSPGTLILTGNNPYVGNTTINAGNLQVDGFIGSKNTIVNINGTLSGNGVLGGNVINGGIVSPGHSPGKLTVKGNYTQTPAGTLIVEVAGKAAAQHDLLVVGGAANLNGGLRLVKLGGFKLKVGDKITFLTAAGGVNGKFATVSNPFSTTGTIVKTKVVYHTNSVALEAKQGSFSDFIKGADCGPNGLAVGKALDNLAFGSKNTKLIKFLNQEPLGNLCNDFDRIAPEELASIFNVGMSLANVQSANLLRRMDDIQAGSTGFSASGYAMNGGGPGYGGGLSAEGVGGPAGKGGKELRAPEDPRLGVFVTGVGEFTNIGNTANARGYDMTTGGFTLGIDYKITPNFAMGINAGYAATGVDLANNGRVNVDGAKLGIYATYFTGTGFYVDAALNGGLNSYETRRGALKGTARGNTNGGEFNALFATGYDWRTGGLRIGPTASVQYTNVGVDSFREHGSLAPLNIASHSGESLRTALGMKASYDIQAGGVVIRPEVRAAWQHEFGDSSFALDSRFANGGGNTFTVRGPQIGDDSLLLGAGVAVLWNERTSTYVYYDGELGRTNYSSNNVSGGVRMSF